MVEFSRLRLLRGVWEVADGRDVEEGEPVPTVQFSVRSMGLEILWGTPCGVLFVVEFCGFVRLRGGSEVDDGRIGERRPSRFQQSNFRSDRWDWKFCGVPPYGVLFVVVLC